MASQAHPAGAVKTEVFSVDLGFENGAVLVGGGKNHPEFLEAFPVPGSSQTDPVAIGGGCGVSQQVGSVLHRRDPAIFDSIIFEGPQTGQVRSVGVLEADAIVAAQEAEVRECGKVSFPIVPRFPRILGIEQGIVMLEGDDLQFTVPDDRKGYPTGILHGTLRHPDKQPNLVFETEDSRVQQTLHHQIGPGRPHLIGGQQGVAPLPLGEVGHDSGQAVELGFSILPLKELKFIR